LFKREISLFIKIRHGIYGADTASIILVFFGYYDQKVANDLIEK